MDGTETGWGRPAEPAPRWRALLDRARHGSRAVDEAAETEREDQEAEARRTAGGQPPGRAGRPFNPLDPRQSESRQGDPARGGFDQRSSERRPVNPLDRRPGRASLGERLGQSEPMPQPEQRPMDPRAMEQRPFDQRALDQRALDQRALDQRALDQRALDQRPVNPLAESRRQSRIGEGFQARPATEEPHSFFNPATRSVPSSIGRVGPELAPPPSRGAASVGAASVMPPPVAPAPLPPPAPPVTSAPKPTSPAAARIEWRQARPEQEDRAVSVLRRKLGKPRVLAFANPKGGVHKTTATVLAAATIGSVRGRGVLAWDDNE